FDIEVWRPYGGQVVDLVFPCLAADWVCSAEGLPFVQSMLRIEEYELERNPASTHYAVAYGRLKSLPRLARPLAAQVRRAVGRRLKPRSRYVGRAIGVDVSEEMIRRGREYCADRANVELYRTDGTLGFLPPDSLDFVFSHIVFQHLPRKVYVERYFREAHRVLKPGGILRVQVDGRSRQFFRRWVADSWSGVVFSARALRARPVRA